MGTARSLLTLMLKSDQKLQTLDICRLYLFIQYRRVLLTTAYIIKYLILFKYLNLTLLSGNNSFSYRKIGNYLKFVLFYFDYMKRLLSVEPTY